MRRIGLLPRKGRPKGTDHFLSCFPGALVFSQPFPTSFNIGFLNDDDYKELDRASETIGRIVTAATTLVDRANWTPGFSG